MQKHVNPGSFTPSLGGGRGEASIPVNVISGFLGSGKTTAIIRLLEQKSTDDCWALVINEYGKVPVDGQTLQEKSINGTVYDITGGCICCSAKTYLYENLDKIVCSGKYQRILIEPTGLGGVEMITEIICHFPQLQLMPVLCLVDVTALNNPRVQCNLVYRMQILTSDIIVFSKCDLIGDLTTLQKIQSDFKHQYPDKLIYPESGQLHPKILSGSFFPHPVNAIFRNKITEIRSTGQSNYFEFHYKTSGEILCDIQSVIDNLIVNQSVVRAKGYLHAPNGWCLFNFTLAGTHIQPCRTKEANEIIVIADSREITFSLWIKRRKLCHRFRTKMCQSFRRKLCH